MTSYYLGLEVPPGPRRRLEQTMRHLGDHFPLPHVTIIAPPRLGSDLGWLEPVRAVVAAFPRFTVSLGAAQTFGDRVLYLTVRSAPLAQLHRDLLAVVGPAAEHDGRTEDPSYTAHLTLVVARRGRSLPPYEEALSKLGRFRPFTANSVVVFARGTGDDQYRAWRHLPLSSATAL